MFTDFVPKHAKKYADIGLTIKKAFSDYVTDVQSEHFPGKEHSF
jgi:3-methyl-2-oxobutanoate hydroxymethyltransferase